MADEINKEEDRELPHSKLEDSLATAGSYTGRPHHQENQHSLTDGAVKRRVTSTTVPGPSIFSDLGIKPPGLFIDTYIPGLSVTIKEISHDIAQFHDSESEDIYDLYNACNGAVREDGFLDDSKLDELTNEEREVLNVKRLREIWRHTISGCATCAGIVKTLNSVRRIVGEEEFEYVDDLDPFHHQ
jgi:hypothetical protein